MNSSSQTSPLVEEEVPTENIRLEIKRNIDPRPRIILLAKSRSDLPKFLVLIDYRHTRETGQ